MASSCFLIAAMFLDFQGKNSLHTTNKRYNLTWVKLSVFFLLYQVDI